ncbi:hypothetical protein PGTUg99_010490 [Puccinia graminis f. sp. tritici]|uniref:Uncharacterized protein n=1 Tax=Puccinia graminis f. sp. tritici TaxID=56615 RepID=A0A5B0RJN4_PUCGR|nr:hypothetical protein PGTUg99_010490 [Puccinia graminis f. sp. tritici]
MSLNIRVGPRPGSYTPTHCPGGGGFGTPKQPRPTAPLTEEPTRPDPRAPETCSKQENPRTPDLQPIQPDTTRSDPTRSNPNRPDPIRDREIGTWTSQPPPILSSTPTLNLDMSTGNDQSRLDLYIKVQELASHPVWPDSNLNTQTTRGGKKVTPQTEPGY